MKLFLFTLVAAFLLHACNATTKEKAIEQEILDTKDSITERPTELLEDAQLDSEPITEISTLYVVIADTGQTYSLLEEAMVKLNDELKFQIDLMDRSYNKEKDLIALNEDSDDEIYAGQYFPRRYTSEFLSLEYLNYYAKSTNEKTIAIVAGIYENKSDAQKRLNKIKNKLTNAYILKSEIYQGCMH